jgi:hypothetical protein
MANEVADANQLLETIANLSIAQTQILEMLQQVIPRCFLSREICAARWSSSTCKSCG